MGEYKAKNLFVDVHFYPVDGVEIAVWKWVNEDWVKLVDSRFICDSFWEAMCSALVEAGYDFEYADALCADWDIFEPEYEEEEVNV